MCKNKQVSRFLYIILGLCIGLSLIFFSPINAQSSPILPGELSKSTAAAEILSANMIFFQDDFNSTVLADEWSWIREDPTLWSLTEQPGWLTLTTHQGALGDSPNLVKNLLVQDAPTADYRIVTRMDFDPDENYTLAGLLVYLDDYNYLLFGRAFCDNPMDCVGNGIYFDFVEEGILEGNYATVTTISPESTYLAITKVGLDYSGWISSDGMHWGFIGTHTTDQAYDLIGLGTTNGDQPTTGIPANFDFLLLEEPARTLPADWDGRGVRKPVVIQDGDGFKMWFNNVTDGRIYYTESVDGTTWDTPVPVLYPGFLEPLIGHHEGSEGQVDSIGCSAFGWVTDPDEYAREITVQVLADGELVEELVASQVRDDVDEAICPEGTCGFGVDLWGKITAGEEHTITVQAYDEESGDWWGLEGTPKSLTCWGYPTGHHDGDEGTMHYPACSASGWAYDPDDPNRDMSVQVLVDGEVLEEMTADLVRDDIDPLICPDGTCGFGFDLIDKIALNQEHEILVQAYDEETDAWYDLIGTPRTLTCAGGKIHLPYISNQVITGARLSVFESGELAFPASTAFHVMHGWRLDWLDPDIDLFDFELEVDGIYLVPNYTEYSIDWSSTPPAISKLNVFNFPDGMTGTHTFNGHWVAPCYAFSDECSDPDELWETKTEVVVTFYP